MRANVATRTLREVFSKLSVGAVLVGVVLAAVEVVCVGGGTASGRGGERPAAFSTSPPLVIPAGIHKIKHVVVIMQENRSFDSYFGTYPGADGIPMSNGRFAVCLPTPMTRRASSPVPRRVARNAVARTRTARPAGHRRWEDGRVHHRASAAMPSTAVAASCVRPAEDRRHGLPRRADIPNYWTYAKDFVLQDHLFEPDAAWSVPSHLFMVSVWSAQVHLVHESAELYDRANANDPAATPRHVRFDLSRGPT